MKDRLPTSESQSIRLRFPVTRECPDQNRLTLFPGVTSDVPREPIPRVRTAIGAVHPLPGRRAERVSSRLTLHVEVVPVDQGRLKMGYQIPSLLCLLFRNERVIHDVCQLMVKALRGNADHACVLCRESPLRPERAVGSRWLRIAATIVA